MSKIVHATLGLPTLWAGPRFQMSKTKARHHFIVKNIVFSSLEHLYFEFVSGFEIRISDFKTRLNAQDGKAFSSLTAIDRGLL
jgi:hypothetical protein